MSPLFNVSNSNMSRMKLIAMPFALNPKPIIVKTCFLCSFHFLCQLDAFNQSHWNFYLFYFLPFVNQASCIWIFFFQFWGSLLLKRL
jgi:hypothetical protein